MRLLHPVGYAGGVLSERAAARLMDSALCCYRPHFTISPNLRCVPQMKHGQLTSVMEDYLKSVYHLLKETGGAYTNDLARLLGVSAPTVTQMIKKLAEAKLVKHSPYKGFVLTPSGEKIALEVIRHHRLIERYLHEALGVPWDKVHEEADKWEHVISEDVEKRMDEMLNYPTHDPHGSPIPSEELVIEVEKLVPLSELGAGDRGVVREVPDEDPALLNYLAELELVPDTAFEVEKLEPFGGPIVLRIGSSSVTLGMEVASLVRTKVAGRAKGAKEKKVTRRTSATKGSGEAGEA